jgi:tetratricopeptide (TPR) repeat protein
MSTHIESIGNIGTANFNFANDKPSLPSNIPLPKGFIGREVELVALRQAKTNGKTSFVLHGISGVGKTDLALKFIEEIKADYSAHIRVDMRGLSDKPPTANGAKLEVIQMFKPDVPANLEDKDINNLYISLLNQHKTILFFDNAKDREQVEPLNNASAFVVITSRATFNVSSGFSLPVEQMLPADARNLLYKITNDEARYDGQADALAYLAGYLPMALLPLGSLLAEYDTIEAVELVAKYKDRKERLQLADPNRENLTVMASFDLSYERLSEELQACWRKLAVFPADFDLEAMQAVWQIADGKTISGELVKKHLLEFNKDTKRLHLHDLSRDYTGEKLSSEERVNAEYTYCVHFGLLLASLKTVTLSNLAKFDIERTNIEYGFAWLSHKIELDEIFAKICGAYVGYSNSILVIRLDIHKFIIWTKIGLKSAEKQNDMHQQANRLGTLGNLYLHLGNSRIALTYHRKSLIFYKETADLKGQGSQLNNLGNVYASLGAFSKAISRFKESLAISKELEDQKSECSSLGNLASIYFQLKRYSESIEYYKSALKLAKKCGFMKNEADWLCGLGLVNLDLGEYANSITYFELALSISKQLGDKQGEAHSIGNLGSLYGTIGNHNKSIKYLEESLILSNEIGDLKVKGSCIGSLGSAYASLGKKDKAINCFKQAIAILESIESPNAELFRQNLARLE